MSSILKVDEIQDTSGNNIINESSDTITIGASGDTVNVVGTLQNNGSALVTGKVLQVIHGSTTTSVTSSSSTEVSTGVTAQITPSSTSNKVLVFGSINGIQIGAATSTGGAWKIRRHDTSTSATSGTNIQSIVNYGGFDNSASDHQYALSFNDLDSPSTTAARNYTITFNRSLGSGSVQVQNNSATSSITLMEIAG
jgi:hypothetical protein